ncbi:MAG: 16S rRNA (guanine(966)-N(2))-methyltransferase RsmD [Proteobacteria bacterium]|nr:MAG: 16S rRNA (guanine(966)-N(2))-methyltransferase RsmD [Pseudomonadota bacterium]
MSHSKKPSRRAAAPPNRLRIIGGRWRGRRIRFPPVAALRPSPDRVRETLFNWLQPRIVGARCLDLFAGSGALGIEALSRGAAAVLFVDSDARVVRHLQATLEELGASGANALTAEAERFLDGPPQPFDVVFLDPPYGYAGLGALCERLARGWLADQALVYLECAADAPLPSLPPGWQVRRAKRAGQVGYHLLETPTAATSETRPS